MARAIYREWFVHFRYPGHEDVPLVDSPLGPIPDGWQCATLGDLVDAVRRPVDSEDGRARVRCGRHGHRRASYVDWASSRCRVERERIAKFGFRHGDVVRRSESADLGRSACVEVEIDGSIRVLPRTLRPTGSHGVAHDCLVRSTLVGRRSIELRYRVRARARHARASAAEGHVELALATPADRAAATLREAQSPLSTRGRCTARSSTRAARGAPRPAPPEARDRADRRVARSTSMR